MRTKTRTAMNLLSLENRLTPSASISLVNGNLTVTGDNTSNTIVVIQQAGNPTNLEVYVSAGQWPSTNIAGLYAKSVPSDPSYRGTYNATGTVYLNGGNSNDQVAVFIPGGATLSSNLRVSLGNSYDDFNLTSISDTQQATLAGNVNVNGGLGADNYNFNLINIQGNVDLIGGGTGTRPDEGNRPGDYARMFDATVQGYAIVRDSALSLDDFFSPVLPGNAGTTIQGNLIVQNTAGGAVGSFNVGYDQDNGTVTPVAGYALIASIGPRSVVNGDFTYTGSGSADGVFIAGAVNGNTTVVAGAGTNTFSMQVLSAGGATLNGTADGNVTFVGSSGADFVDLGDAVISAAGSVNLTMGDGANTYDMTGGFFVSGSFTVNAGTGNDNVTFGAGSNIAGNLNVNLGTGNNGINLAGAVFGSQVNLTTGGGNDVISVAPTAGGSSAKLSVYAGAGNDLVNIGSSAFLSAYLDGQTGTDTIAFTSGFVVPINWSLLNFEAGGIYVPRPAFVAAPKIVDGGL
ncbi:MAG: hypothetical protein K1X57_17570 [Gemmataceae bacterium]|nr:hypothetical protein [Gemmataceae bacterium]